MELEQLTDPRLREEPGFEAAWAAVSRIEGWLSREQAEALYEAAAEVAPGRWIVELGSHHGRSTVALGKGKPASVRLLAVDPFLAPPVGHGEDAYRSLLANLRRHSLDDSVHLFRGPSAQAADGFPLLTDVLAPRGEDGAPAEVGLLFVDARHDRSSVLEDISHWEPLVGDGGLVCFHDAFFRLGVTLAVLQRHLMSTNFRYLDSVGNLAIFRREYVGTTPAVLGSLRLLARLRYFLRNVIVTIAVRRDWRWLQRLVPPEKDFQY